MSGARNSAPDHFNIRQVLDDVTPTSGGQEQWSQL